VNVGWCGLGKLGLTCALVMQQRAGHDVYGYDPSPHPANVLAGAAKPPKERHIGDLLAGNRLKLVNDPDALVAACDVIFVAVQTPHAPAYEGVTPAPAERRDFEYQFLVAACRGICEAATRQAKPITTVVVSTVLPGTCNRLIRPLLNDHVTLVYGPSFIAMGTTADDFTHPEFVLLGADQPRHTEPVVEVYRALHGQPIKTMSIESAELTKVAYNLYVSAKIVLANTVMEICHKTGADCDDVTDALELATDRIISPAYMRGGMGDGGSCHPRDAIALTWLADRLELSADPFEFITRAREDQTGWLADLVESYADQTGLPIVILGKAYKPESDLTAGSPSLLLANLLVQRGRAVSHWDPHVDALDPPFRTANAFASVFVVGTKHPEFPEMTFAKGSVVVDPHGYIPDRPGVTVIRVGRKN
jgi:UDPglucose 6-dehydrogenase